MNITTVFGPPPPGINLEDDRIFQDNAVVASICVLAAITVISRFIVRIYVQGVRPEVDDWFIGASVVLLIALLSATLYGGLFGFGRHVWCTTLEDMVVMKKTLFAYLIIYLAELLFIKCSILMFYRRIFGMNWMISACLFIAYSWAIGSMIAALCACHPVSYFWNEAIDPQSGWYRYNFYYYYIGNAAANVVTDVLILLIPIPIVWKLHMRTTQKIGVCGVLLLGGFVCVASGIRIHYLTFLDGNPDITWTLSDVSVWSTVEPCIGIICACLPVLQPVLRSMVKKMPNLPGSQYIQTRRLTASVQRRVSCHKRDSSKHDVWHGRAQECQMSPTPFLHSDGDQAALTTVRTRVEIEKDPNEKYRFDEDLIPMAIRVKRVVHWSID
ncbi:hypothetical protein N7475_004660 [Penicillium sp. IBT 31633x]|nr:hypothetical protein N7475_004660 [Penicillium sp. IBT 31633x]